MCHISHVSRSDACQRDPFSVPHTPLYGTGGWKNRPYGGKIPILRRGRSEFTGDEDAFDEFVDNQVIRVGNGKEIQ